MEKVESKTDVCSGNTRRIAYISYVKFKDRISIKYLVLFTLIFSDIPTKHVNDGMFAVYLLFMSVHFLNDMRQKLHIYFINDRAQCFHYIQSNFNRSKYHYLKQILSLTETPFLFIEYIVLTLFS